MCWVTTAYAHGPYLDIMDIELDNGSAPFMNSSAYFAVDHRIKHIPKMLSNVMAYDKQIS